MKLSKKLIIAIASVLILTIGGGVVYAINTPTAQAERQLKLADKYLQDGRYQEAILAFQKVIEIEPKNVQARISLSKAYIAINQVEKAEQELKSAIDINPKVSDLYLELANLYIANNEIDIAISLLEQGYSITNDEKIKKLLDESKGKRDQATQKTDQSLLPETKKEEKRPEVEPVVEPQKSAPIVEITKEVPKQEPVKAAPDKNLNSSKYQRFTGGLIVRQCNSEEILKLKNINPGLEFYSAVHYETIFKEIQPREFLNKCYFLEEYISKEPITDKLIEDYWNQNELYNSRASDKSKSFANDTYNIQTGDDIVFEGSGSYYAAVFYLDENGQIVGINYYPGTININ